MRMRSALDSVGFCATKQQSHDRVRQLSLVWFGELLYIGSEQQEKARFRGVGENLNFSCDFFDKKS